MSANLLRLRPGALFNSFFWFLDIKLGAEIILLFGLINKVAGVYGLITIFVGGSFVQLLFYAYSIATLFAFLWALRIVKSENANPTILVSHLYALDHVILSGFHYLFFRSYWYDNAHDGKRNANSQAQQDLINLAASRGEIPMPTDSSDQDDATRAAQAGQIWEEERVYAGWALVFGWLLKLYFILILYSYAAHLRSSTYHALPLTSRSKATQIAHPTTEADLEAELNNDDFEPGASNGDVGKGNLFVGRKESIEESRMENGQASIPRPGEGRKDKGKARDGGDDDFSWD